MLQKGGKLIFITLEASDAANAVSNIIDYFPLEKHAQIREILAQATRGIITQYLLPGTNKDCILPAVEILINSKDVSEVIKEGNVAELYSLIENSQHPDMKSLDSSLFELFKNNLISQDTVLNMAQDFRKFSA